MTLGVVSTAMVLPIIIASVVVDKVSTRDSYGRYEGCPSAA